MTGQEPRPLQRDVFLAGEGDAYERRNVSAPGFAPLVDELAGLLSAGDVVLEVGCGAGQNLVELERRVPGIVCHGVDPSKDAIDRGIQRSPHHDLRVGTSDLLPFDHQFDAIVFGFCLYLVDRPLLHKTVAEADRLLRGRESNGKGFLVIVDFDATIPHRRPYRHSALVQTYKMDYSQLFLADPAYRLVSKTAFDHGRFEVGWAETTEDRVAIWTLAKDGEVGYADSP